MNPDTPNCPNYPFVILEKSDLVELLETTYTNQTGGYACNHQKIVGRGYPIPIEESILTDHFTGEKYGGWCCDGIDEETANWMDSILHKFSISVDRMKLKESQEAWVYIKSKLPGLNYELTGVLTWTNSD